jgi:hypothetical protein
MKTAISVIGLCSGVLAAVCLYYASSETPWGMQSLGGRRRRSGDLDDGEPGARG